MVWRSERLHSMAEKNTGHTQPEFVSHALDLAMGVETDSAVWTDASEWNFRTLKIFRNGLRSLTVYPIQLSKSRRI